MDEFHSSTNVGSTEKLTSASLEAIITLPMGNSTNIHDVHGKKSGKERRTDYSKLLSSLYALLIVLVGVLFPMTEALHGEWHETIYNMIFIVYTLSVSCLCIIYLQWVLIRQQHQHHDKLASTTASNESSSRSSSLSNDDHHHHRVQTRRRSSAAPDFTVRQTKHGLLIENSNDIVDAESDTHRSSVAMGANHHVASSGHSNTSSSMYAKRSGVKNSINGGISAKLRFGNSNMASSAVGDSNNHGMSSIGASPASYDHEYNMQHSNSSLNTAPHHQHHHHHHRSWSTDDEDRLTDYSNEEQQQDQDGGEVWIDLSKLGTVFSHEGSSLYLRMGELIFAIGNVIYIALEIEYHLDPSTSSCSGTYSWTFYIRLVFILFQTFFLFKNPTMHVHKHGAMVRFALMHLIATNVSVWLRTLANEIMNEYDHLSHYSTTAAAADDSSNSSASKCNSHDSILQDTMPYLFPFVLEYSLIAMGTLAIMFAEVNSEGDANSNALRGLQNLFKVQALEKSSKSTHFEEEGKSVDQSLLPTLTKSHRGLFAGIILLSGGFIAVLLFYLDPTSNQSIIYLATDCTVHSLMLIAAVMAMVKLHKLSYIARPVSVDDVLLIVSMCGAVLYELSIIMASGHYISDYSNHSGSTDSGHPSNHSQFAGDTSESTNDEDPRSIEILRLCSSMVACLQSIVQLLLSISALRRYPSKQKHLKKMPGRGLITFLIISNVTVWICRTCLIKALSPSTQLEYYGLITWLLLLNISLPLLLFYRFHSSVCLADVWHSAYTSPFHSTGHGSSSSQHSTGKAGSLAKAPSISNLEARSAGVSTLLKSYSMPHLTPPRPTRSSHRSTSVKPAHGSGFSHVLPHIEDVEDVEDIENDIQATSAKVMKF